MKCWSTHAGTVKVSISSTAILRCLVVAVPAETSVDGGGTHGMFNRSCLIARRLLSDGTRFFGLVCLLAFSRGLIAGST